MAAVILGLGYLYYRNPQNADVSLSWPGSISEAFSEVESLITGVPSEVRELMNQETVMTDTEGHQEYYFRQLNAGQQKAYRQMLQGIRGRKIEFYITLEDNEEIDQTYHAILKDHPELYYIHNRKTVYKTMFKSGGFSLFSPGYTYTEEESAQIEASMEEAYQTVAGQITAESSEYDIVKAVYTYIIKLCEYKENEDDQSIAGCLWRKEAVCAGYAGAVQYLLERFSIPVIYVDGDTSGSDTGHAWNIVQIGESYYYLDATNGDQPNFISGDDASLEMHETIIYDYLCPFPWEYETMYTAVDEFSVPECTSTALNFYVLNQGCFDSYDPQTIYDYTAMRINNNAAVIRFKFTSSDLFQYAMDDLFNGGSVNNTAQYYMQYHGISQVNFHYGPLEALNTIYLIF